MARMIPPYYSEKIESAGEKRIFELLKNDPGTSDWVSLHSLALTKHIKRSYGEIDFVLMVPGEGIFCLEVKSGSISRNGGIWNYRNRYGEIVADTRGPFRQAEEGMFSLLSTVQKKFGKYHRLSHLLYGYAVILPYILFEQTDPEYEPWQIYDRESTRQPISAFIRRLSMHTHGKMKNERWYDPGKSRPTSDDINELVDFLRGDFELFVKPSDILVKAEKQLLRLTEEQYRCLDGIQDNSRCLIQGGSGTGKTLLAIEFARREGRAGRRVLLVCFNTFLGHRVAAEVASLPGGSSITAHYYHHFLEHVISNSSRRNEFHLLQNTVDKTKFFTETYPMFAMGAINEGVIKEFDTLVVDEGQDLIRQENLDILDSLLKGGLAGGRWMIFCDFYHQAIYSNFSPEEILEELNRRSPLYCHFRLTINCRNTRQIGEETALLSGFGIPPFRIADVEGFPVEYRFFTDTQNQKQIVMQILSNLINEGIPSEWITILSPKTRQHSCITPLLMEPPCPIEDLNENNVLNRKRGTVVFSTIHAFKGLESPVVIITDIEHLADSLHQSLLYVGMSRARERLFVLIAESIKSEYLAAVKKWLEKGVVSHEKPDH
jgi:hypothetical protein